MRREIRYFRYIMFHHLDSSCGCHIPERDLQPCLPNVEIANSSFGEVHSPVVVKFYIYIRFTSKFILYTLVNSVDFVLKMLL